MRTAPVISWCLRASLSALVITSCAPVDEDSDDWIETDEEAIAVAGRWIPNAAVTNAANRQFARYDDAPAWNGGRNCGGSFHPGTRELGDYLRANFRAVSSYGGYSCRPNTADTSRTSVHGTGRAIDVFIPLSRGDADNTLGDPVANWLITNASVLGVQLVIWDRSSWNASRPAGSKLRAYGGPHPHHDHLHVELNADGAARRTAWYNNHGVATPPSGTVTPPPPPPPPPPTDTRPQMRVTASTLNLRNAPNTSGSVLRTMPCGATVTVLGGPSAGWYNVLYNGTNGWASGMYLVASNAFNASVCN